ncbi:MAG: N-acetyltransferase [Butyrivibrio sp.]|nr:N-acetyltransferase [Butyrivibrio sp.]
MLKNLIVRAETPADYKDTELMAMRSFFNKYEPAASEHFLIRIVRESEDYIPEISRIAEYNGRIVGAVYYTKAWIVDGDVRHEIATFGPLAVEPTLEGNDIGGILMRETIRLAKEAGIKGIALMGEPNYYPRFGFERGAKYGLTDPEGNVFDELMCLPLNDDFSGIKGKLIESKDFEKLEDEEMLAEINKEFPVYRRVKVQEGFMQIFEQHLGVVEDIIGDTYMVRYWELLIPAKLSDKVKEKVEKGSDVIFTWNHKGGDSVITKIFKNLLEC